MPSVLRIFMPVFFAAGALSAQDAPLELPTSPPGSREAREDRFADRLSGDWCGARRTLGDAGIELIFEYTGDFLSCLSGGMSPGSNYNAVLQSGLSADFEKLADWEGGSFFIDSLWFHGPSISSKHVGDILSVSGVDDLDTIRLFELWYQQNFLENAISVKLGQLDPSREFGYSDASSIFVNGTFGQPAVIWADTPALYYYFASPGIRLRLTPVENFDLQAGCYDGNPDPTAGLEGEYGNLNSSGTQISFNEGFFAMFEAVCRWQQGENDRFAGTARIGGWLHTDSFPSQYDQALSDQDSALAPAEISRLPGNHGLFFMVDQRVFAESDDPTQGLTLFARVGGSPASRNLIDLYTDGGAVYTGPIPGRDEDQMGVAFAFARMSRDIRRAFQDMNDAGEGPLDLPDHESVLEFTYSAVIVPGWAIQPDFQWVFHPGGSDAIADAVVVGIRTTLSF